MADARIMNKYQINDRTYQTGDKVWWYDAWDCLRWGTIYEIVETQNKVYAKIYENNKKGRCMGSEISECWHSKNACIRARECRIEEQKSEYKKSIRTVEDLVRFLFHHDVSSENLDFAAKFAAVERAAELGISLE